MINRITASVIRRLNLPFEYVGGGKGSGPEALALEEMKAKLAGVARYTPGRVSAGHWDLSYVDAPALVSCFEVAMVDRWNDFVAERDDPRILDCGANVGVTVLRYKSLYPKARITAFEPDREICQVLRRNLAANGADGVEVVEGAVWTAAGRHAFVSEGADGSRLAPVPEAGDGDGAAAAPGRPEDAYMVNTVRLADYLSEEVDFVKLDIEGAESEVLLDCAERLRNVRSMAIEFHLMNDRPQKLAPAFEVLAGAGFSLSVNSYGPWVDLVRPPEKKPEGDFSFDQYMLVCAWRPASSSARV